MTDFPRAGSFGDEKRFPVPGLIQSPPEPDCIFSTMNILIVEDNKQMLRAIRICLADVVAEIYECDDGCEALSTYGSCRPDWVLMDLEMPGLCGFEVARQIKSAYPDAQIVVFTNYDGGDLRMAAEEAGACAFVVKENLLAVREILVKSGRE